MVTAAQPLPRHSSIDTNAGPSPSSLPKPVQGIVVEGAADVNARTLPLGFGSAVYVGDLTKAGKASALQLPNKTRLVNACSDIPLKDFKP